MERLLRAIRIKIAAVHIVGKGLALVKEGGRFKSSLKKYVHTHVGKKVQNSSESTWNIEILQKWI